MSGVIDSQELEVAHFLQLSRGLPVDKPLLILSTLEVLLLRPLDCVGPGLSSSPVADEVFVAAVDEDVCLGGVEKELNLVSKVEQPVAHHEGMDSGAAHCPSAAGNVELLLHFCLVQELLSQSHVVTCWRHVTLLSDVVNIELGISWVSEDCSGEQLAVLESVHPVAFLNELLANLEGALQQIIGNSPHQVILLSKLGILGVLHVRVYPSIADGNSLQIHAIVGGIGQVVVSNRWNVVTSITLTCEIEVSTLELWILLKEPVNELLEVVSNLLFISFVVEDAGALAEPSAHGLVDKEEVGDIVPGVLVFLESQILLDNEGSVLVKESNFGGATWSACQPDDQGVLIFLAP